MSEQPFGIPDPIKSYDPETNTYTYRTQLGNIVWTETAEIGHTAPNWTEHPNLQRINRYLANNPIHQREYSHIEFIEALKEHTHDR